MVASKASILTCGPNCLRLPRSADAGEGISSSPPNNKRGLGHCAPKVRLAQVRWHLRQSNHDGYATPIFLPAPPASPGPYRLSLLSGNLLVLLEVPPVRFCHLPGLYGREFLGTFLQWDYLGVSGLRRLQRLRQPVTDCVKHPIIGVVLHSSSVRRTGVRLLPRNSHALISGV